MAKFTPLLAAAPKVEIYHLCRQANTQPPAQHPQIGEVALGLHIEDPFDAHPSLVEVGLEEKTRLRLLSN